MSSAFPGTGGLIRDLKYGLAAILLVFSSATFAQSASDVSDVAVVDDVVIYHAILPAEMLRTYPAGSQEALMHGGVPGGKHFHHLQIALFDARTNARITDASVSATISEVGLAGSLQELEPFAIGDALTYGGYFGFSKLDLYKIEVRATLPDGDRVIEHSFEYRHQ